MDTAEETKRQLARERSARYRARHPDRCRESQKKSIARHKPPGWRKDYYQRNKSKWKTDPVKSRAKALKWYRENKAKVLANVKAWSIKNPEKVIAARARWNKSEKGKASRDRWNKQNPGKLIARQQKRRALKRAATVNLKNIERWIQSVRSKQTAICYYCQKPIPSEKIHFDHIVPLSRGGAHSVGNLCVSCQPCNNRKHAKSVQAFVISGQQILSL